MELEDIIKRRIKDEAWDDVERILVPRERAFRPREELSQEKSKLGLAEVCVAFDATHRTAPLGSSTHHALSVMLCFAV
jgi:U3 small nucleolar ribonucleoprotein component